MILNSWIDNFHVTHGINSFASHILRQCLGLGIIIGELFLLIGLVKFGN